MCVAPATAWTQDAEPAQVAPGELPEMADPLDGPGLRAAVPAPAAWPGAPVGTRIVLYRGAGCGPTERIRFSPRRVRPCTAEQRVELTVGNGGNVQFRALSDGPARLPQLPAELALQWRTCPWHPVAALQGPGSPFVPYEDPQVGRCYLWRPLDRAEWERISPLVHGERLQGAQPYLAAAIRELAVRAAKHGIEVHILRSVSAMAIKRDHHGSHGKAKSKKHRHKAHYQHRGGRFTYMHPWGQAVDLTIGWKKPMMAPEAHYHRGSHTWKSFRTLGAWATEMGLVWLGAVMRGELAHFEFHPTTWGTVDGPDLQKMLRLYRQGGVEKAHEALQFDGETPSPFAALRDSADWP